MSVVTTRDDTTPVLAEPPRRVVDIAALVAEESERLEKLYRQPTFLQAMRPKWEIEDYLHRVLELHAPIVERWGAWRWHSGPLEAVGLDERELPVIFDKVISEFLEKGLELMQWESAEAEAWCRYRNCHFPRPVPTVDLFRSREFKSNIPALKEAVYDYASLQRVKVRVGQAVSRAILAELNKLYKVKDNEKAALYLAMWNRLFERLGQSWAGGKPLGITLTIAPCDILRFGHLGETSCYTTGHTREHSKLNLTLVPNSFGMFFYRDLEAEPPLPTALRAAAPSGRAWGVAEFALGGAVLTNTYLENWDTVAPSVLRALHESLGFEDLRRDPGKWGTLNRLGIKYSKKVFAFVNADQWVAAPDGQAEVVHLNAADGVEAFVLKRSNQHGKVACCSSCNTPADDGDDIMLCQCQRCAITEYEEKRVEVCKHCVQSCGGCNTQFSRECSPERGRACSGCNKSVCGACANGRTSCRGCKKTWCKVCAEGNPAAVMIECKRCNHCMCGDCNKGCSVKNCEHTKGRCRACSPMITCAKCGNSCCTHHIQQGYGGLVQACKTCVDALPPPAMGVELMETFGQALRVNRYDNRVPEEQMIIVITEAVRMSWEESPLYDAQPAAAGD